VDTLATGNGAVIIISDKTTPSTSLPAGSTPVFNLLCDRRTTSTAAGCCPCALPHRRVRQHRQNPKWKKLMSTIRSARLRCHVCRHRASQGTLKDNSDTTSATAIAPCSLAQGATTLKELSAAQGKKPLPFNSEDPVVRGFHSLTTKARQELMSQADMPTERRQCNCSCAA
jgi:hypothetical protein